MKKIILLVLVALMGVQVVSAVEKSKRPSVESRVRFQTSKYGLTEEQQAEMTKLYSELEAKGIDDDVEYKKGIGAINKIISTKILTPEQKQKAADAAAAKKAAKNK